ncbi:hypothetical protein LNQ52_19160 [Klebsiella pneumoniae subsp. pneumoniae]|nr:hypothetical protein [Klebsiella pneumoniae subsp. pneumoniae]
MQRPVLHQRPADRQRTWNEGLRQPGKTRKDDPQSSSNATGETPRIEGFTSRDGNVEFAWTPGKNHDFTAGYGFDRQDRDSDSLDRNRLERENYL